MRVKPTILTRVRLLLAIATLGVAVTACSDGAAQSYKSYTPAEVDTFLKQDTSAVVLDVRTPEEYSSETGHLKNARLIPVQQLEDRVGELASVKNKTVVTYCRSGHRSKQASEILSKKGFKVVNMDGGIMAWNAAGLPTEKGPVR